MTKKKPSYSNCQKRQGTILPIVCLGLGYLLKKLFKVSDKPLCPVITIAHGSQTSPKPPPPHSTL